MVKLHILCDIANHLITNVEVTDEHTADGGEFSKLVNGAMGKVNKVFGDSAYDSSDNFNAAMDTEPIIKPKINSTGKSKGSYVRAQTVREFLMDPVKWKKGHRYGQRWQVKTVFSSLKRILGSTYLPRLTAAYTTK
ncbi:MAG: transposase [Thermoplasmatales archaeon]